MSCGQIVQLGTFSYVWNLDFDWKKCERFESPIFTAGVKCSFDCRLSLFCSTLSSLRLRLELVRFDVLGVETNLEGFDAFVLNNDMDRIYNLTLYNPTKSYMSRMVYESKNYEKFESLFIEKRNNITCNGKIKILLLVKENHKALKILNCQFNEFDDFEMLLKNRTFSDVNFSVDGKIFKAHKSILTTRSKVFSKMLKDQRTQDGQISMQITDVGSNVMQELLRFIYCGKVEGLDVLAKDLLIAADKFDIQDLKKLTEISIFKSLSTDNAVDILSLAHLSRADKLFKHVVDFIVVNIKLSKELQSSYVFINLPSSLLARAYSHVCLREYSS